MLKKLWHIEHWDCKLLKIWGKILGRVMVALKSVNKLNKLKLISPIKPLWIS